MRSGMVLSLEPCRTACWKRTFQRAGLLPPCPSAEALDADSRRRRPYWLRCHYVRRSTVAPAFAPTGDTRKGAQHA
ncbi:hypothetical protein GCM10027063_05960 [Promicromonospora xylanilytica]